MSDNAIWAVTGPEHDARMARELAWIATGGQTGVVGPESCMVSAQGTPNDTVRIMPGSVAIAATSQTAAIGYTSAPGQAYMRRIYEPLNVEIEATSSSGSRTDVVGIVVDDPEFEGTSPDVDTHQYWRPHVVRNAGNNATRPEHFASLGRPFLPLAQVRIPASTATITNAMIHDIRFLAVSRSHTVDLVTEANPSDGAIDISASQTNWLDLAEFTGIQIPQWASRASVAMTLTTAHNVSGRTMGNFRSGITGSNGTVWSSGTSFLEDSGLWTRTSLHVAGEMDIHPSSRGGTCRVRSQIRRTNTGSHSGVLRIPGLNQSMAMLAGRITFEEAPRFNADGA